MQFLAYNQTFLGVLASLLVLLIVFDENNLINGLLRHIAKKVDDVIKDISLNLKGISKNDYKEHIQTVLETMKTEGYAKEADVVRLYWNLKASNLIGRYLPNIHETLKLKTNHLIGHIKDINLREVAPLYSLICCFMLFFADMLVLVYPRTMDVIMSIFSLWLGLSSLFWTMMWIGCWRSLESYFSNSSEVQEEKESEKKWRSPRIFLVIFFWLMIIVVLYRFINLQFEGNIYANFILFAIVILIPCLFYGIRMCKSSDAIDKYTYGHGWTHGKLFFFYSVMVTFGALGFQRFLGWPMTVEYEDTSILTSLWCVFITFNGLIMPYLIAYITYRKTLALAEKSYAKAKDEIAAEFDKLNAIAQERAEEYLSKRSY